MWSGLSSCARAGRRADGFTFVEVLIATALFTGALAGVVQLVVMASRSTVVSRDISYASALASQKLHALSSDDPAALTLSPPDAWMRTAGGDVEYLDAAGRVLAVRGAPPGGAIYVRRWSITPLADDLTGGVAFQVSVGRLRRRPLDGMPADALPWDVARVVGVRTGRVP